VTRESEQDLAGGGSPRADDQRVEDLKDATIVMIDDEETTLDVIEMFLRDQGYTRFATTTDSRSALELINREKPDIVLLDLSMPHVDGLEILRDVRADESLVHIPVVILSATDSHQKLSALELGAADFLSKPVDPSELALRLRNTLAAKSYQDRLAYYDSLTGLPNRRLFIERMAGDLARLRRESGECAVLHIGLDRFKQINDTLGRHVGDQILKHFGRRLSGCIRSSDPFGKTGARKQASPLSRVGGDEFAIFLSGANCVDRAARVARRVISALSDPFRTDDQDLFATAGVGIALFPSDGDDIETLLRKADIAMSHAKQGGRNTYQFYNDSLNAELDERVRMENELRGAIDRKELSLEYQPKFNIRTGQVAGVEVLMRWKHAELGQVSPERFIPVAEDSGLIAELGEWALRTACQQARSWQDAGLGPIRIAVNVSSQQFRSGLVQTVKGALESSGLSPRHLVLELTESVIMEDPDQAAAMLGEIAQLGAKLSVDDFGTGYSSLSYLKRFPLAELKIDRSFVNGLPGDADGAAIVTAIVAMAHSLGLAEAATKARDTCSADPSQRANGPP
jgi:diguanylate cyclase (GGDEF)-like protein